MSDIYSDVDGSSSPSEALEWQRRVDSWPSISAYKQRTYELLGDGIVLDVGAGPGYDAVALGVERCVGLDLSATMCAAASALGVRMVRADIASLPARGGSIEGIRADRVLQHVVEPETAIEEMLRVLRPGGRIVISDPDQTGLRIRIPGITSTMAERVKELRCDVGYLNGRIAASYAAILDLGGLADITEDVFPLVLKDPRDAFGMEQWPRIWRDRGIGNFAEHELREWERALAGDCPGFEYSLEYIVVSGIKR